MPPIKKPNSNKTRNKTVIKTKTRCDKNLHKIIDKKIAKPKNRELLRNVPYSMVEEKQNYNTTVYKDLKSIKKLSNRSNWHEITNHKTHFKGVPITKHNIEDVLAKSPDLERYWKKRYTYFKYFDEGIQLDEESFYSVTPEKVAEQQAKRMACDVMIDGFCGCGGNTIQFAMTCNRVIAIDIDPEKIEMARHNAGIYGVADKIDFIVGDFLELCESGDLQGDVVFLSPPWGGPAYAKLPKYDIERNLEPIAASKLMKLAQKVSKNVVFFLPKRSKPGQIMALAEGRKYKKDCNLDRNGKTMGLTAYYGDYFNKDNT